MSRGRSLFRSNQWVKSGDVRHDPQSFMGKTLYVLHFNRDTVEFASREKDESKPGIKTLLPFLKNITEESDLKNSHDLIVASDACYWLHKVISISLSRFRDDQRCDFRRRFPASQKILSAVQCCAYMYIFISEKEISSLYLDLLKLRPFNSNV